ncbi:MAG: ribonuclease J [Oligoflexia bacterium]|nr:ribonuclease J [Oligoflexia bacterium]
MLRIIPLGGIGEIGMNMVLIGTGSESILVDCGIGFAIKPYYGIETVVADFEELFKRHSGISSLFITHGHEDHIGGIPHMLKEHKIKIYASPYASELIRYKCADRLGSRFKPDIQTVKGFEKIELESMSVEFIPVDHSIPDSCALFIKTVDCNILYITDFRLKGLNRDGFVQRVGELRREYGEITILMSDSTNAMDENVNLGEDDVFTGLDGFFPRAEKKIIVTLFSSNVSRINQVISLCKKYNKKLFISGANIKMHMEISRRLGYLTPDDGCIRPDSEYSSTRDEEIVLLCTGSQAEENSSIQKLSFGYHQFAGAGQGDLIIFSASQIPGNEKTITLAINRLIDRGARVVFSEKDRVHCSGHAYRNELGELIDVVKPGFIIPVHGESMHIQSHYDLALEKGIKKDNCVRLDTEKEFVYEGGSYTINDQPPLKRYFVDSSTGELIENDIIRQRARAAANGILFISIVTNEKGKILKKPELVPYGIAENNKTRKVIEGIGWKVYDYCKNSGSKFNTKKINDLENLAKREFRSTFEGKPQVVINIINV